MLKDHWLPFLYYNIFSWVILSSLIFNIYYFESFLLGVILGFIYLIFFGFELGYLLFPKNGFFFQTLYGLLFLLTGISLIGAIIYYFYQLNNAVIVFLIIIIPILLFVFQYSFPDRNIVETFLKKRFQKNFGGGISLGVTKSERLMMIFLLLSWFFSIVIAFKILFISKTTEAIRSPWGVVPPIFFIFYFLATFCLVILAFSKRTGTLTKNIAIIIHFFLSLSLALIIYPLGYGFDSIIHQATEKVISEIGIIYPKPWYYLGQYSLVVFLSKMFNAPIEYIDKLLVPLLASLYLPLTLYYFFDKARLESAIFLLTLPYSTFIVTTPYALSSFYLLILLFTASILPLSYLLFLTLAILFIHPLTGIGAFIFLIFLVLNKLNQTRSLVRLIIFILIFASLLPLMFLMLSFLNSQWQVSFDNEMISMPSLYLSSRFRLWRDLIYLYGFNFIYLFFIVSLLGYILVKKLKTPFAQDGAPFPLKSEWGMNKKWYLLTFLILIVNYFFFKKFLIFSFLIDYEQNDYSRRLLEISLYFLVPFFLLALSKWSFKIISSSLIQKTFWLILLSAFITASLYLSYPRTDDYALSRLFNVSQSDIEAVQAINKDAQDKDYIVLANQSVSAAAIKEFGFKRYYKTSVGPIFYYPLPTSSPLYQYYLKMVYQKPSRQTIQQALGLVGTKQAYFVVNQYWWGSDRIIKEAKKTTSDWAIIDNGKVWIFKYKP